MSGEAPLGMTKSRPRVRRLTKIAAGNAHHGSRGMGLSIDFNVLSAASKFPMADAGTRTLSIAAFPRQDHHLQPTRARQHNFISRAIGKSIGKSGDQNPG